MQFKQPILSMDKHEVFELVDALYTFAVLNHSGQWSDLYALQCEIGHHYQPGHGWSESTVEAENMYYPDINESNARNVWTRCEYYLDNRWD